jgi:hypothetical protein
MAKKQITVTIDSSTTATGPYNVYITSVSDDNLLEANVSLANMKAGRIYRVDSSIDAVFITNENNDCCCSIKKINFTAAPTPSPTTAAPTTAAPTTAAPTTAAPTTAAPTTSSPTTAAPTTAAPTTSAPTTASPTTSAPTTSAPTTAAPTTAAPTTAAPTTAAPTTSSPTTAAPTTAAPTTPPPTYFEYEIYASTFGYSNSADACTNQPTDVSTTFYAAESLIQNVTRMYSDTSLITGFVGGDKWYAFTKTGAPTPVYRAQMSNGGILSNSASC